MKIKLSKSQWEEVGKKSGWIKKAQSDESVAETKSEYKEMPKAELKITRKFKDGSYEVTYPVSYRYNGGIIIGDNWYKGYHVPKPDIPEGFELVNIGVGLQLNARPPYATMLVMPIKKQ